MAQYNHLFCRVYRVTFVLVLLLSPAFTKAQHESYSISGNVHLPSNYQWSSGQKIYIFLLTKNTFKKPYTGIRKINPPLTENGKGKVPFEIQEVEKGHYALRCFLDENKNGELDTFLMIPREPWGLSWKNGKMSIPPGFKDVSFVVDGQVSVDIFLKD